MKIQSTNNKDIQYHILKTEHKDFVKGVCSIPMGVLYADYESRHIPDLLSSMLKLGTKSTSEEELNELLESKGIQIWTDATDYSIKMGFTCLTKHLDETISLIAEQLSEPKFDKDSFESLKQRVLAHYASLKDETSYRAQIALSQAFFPKEHIACLSEPEEIISLIEKTDVKDIEAYHQNHINFAKAVWVFSGDVPENMQAICEKHMPKEGHDTEIQRSSDTVEAKGSEQKVVIAEKQSVDFIMGHVFPIDRKHKDFIPLMLALDALGGSFSARLMRTVRDEDGLTYNVGSSIGSGINGSQCYWTAHGSFAPKLLEKGVNAIDHQLKLWVEEGLSEEELSERKAGLIGKYQVRLSDAGSLVAKISSNIETGFDAEYLHSFCDEVEQVTLAEVNQAIKDYIQLDKAVKVMAGSI